MLTDISTEFFFEKLSVFRKALSVASTSIFELAVESGKNVPFWVIVGLLHIDGKKSQTHELSTLD